MPCSSWVRVFHGLALVITCSVSSVSALKSTVAARALAKTALEGVEALGLKSNPKCRPVPTPRLYSPTGTLLAPSLSWGKGQFL